MPPKKCSQADAHKRRKQANTIEISNRYSELSDEEDIKDAIPGNPSAQKLKSVPETRKPKIPPLNISSDVNTIIKLIKDKKIINYKLKQTSIGTKLLLDTKEDYVQLKQVLTNNGIQFFTHQLRENAVFKAFLHGLPPLDIEEPKQVLINKQIPVESVKMIPVKKPRYRDQTLYLCLINKIDGYNLSILKKKITSLKMC